MIILHNPVDTEQLKEMSSKTFGNLVKAVVDIEREIMIIDAELHSDQESALIEDGSEQKHLWGINLYPEFGNDDPRFVEFDSMINLRPWDNNSTRGVEDPSTREMIITIVKKWVK